MKHTSLRIAVVAAVTATMAALTAAPASAGTVLCASQTATCAQEDVGPVGTDLVTEEASQGNSGVFITWASYPLFTCSDDVIGAESTMRNGNPLPAQFSATVEASECNVQIQSGTECSSVTMNSPPTTIEATEEGGAVEVGTGAEPFSISFACDFKDTGEETCTYEATEAVSVTVSETKATVKGAPVTLEEGESWACGSFAESGLDLRVYNQPAESSPAISSATETVLCDRAEWSDPCPNSAVEPTGTEVMTGALHPDLHSFKIKKSGGTKYHECNNWGLAFEITAQSGQPLGAEGSYGAVNASSCTAFAYGERPCSAAEINTPGAAIEATGEQQATIEVGTAEQPLMLSFTCEIFTYGECTYEATGPVTMEVDGAEETLTIDEAPLKRVEGVSLFCGPESGMVLDMEAAFASYSEIASI